MMNFVERSRDDDCGSEPHDDDDEQQTEQTENNQKPLTGSDERGRDAQPLT